MLDSDFKLFSRAVESACESVIAAEPEITRYDTIAGDGDCGTCLKAGADGEWCGCPTFVISKLIFQ